MQMKSKVMLVGIEMYESKKGQRYAKCLFSDGGANSVLVMTKDLTIFDMPLFSSLNAVFDYNPNSEYNKLSLCAFELCIE